MTKTERNAAIEEIIRIGYEAAVALAKQSRGSDATPRPADAAMIIRRSLQAASNIRLTIRRVKDVTLLTNNPNL